ncbi:MAG: SufE family protein [Gammaproteobacteria bacterium]|nr:SufE family protein [Gammaproteobacteria bacterium]
MMLSEFSPTLPPATVQEIRDSFAFFDGWEDKYRFLIDLGKSLPELPEEFRTETNLVRGCQSQVWLISHCDAQTGCLQFALDSDAHIVRGLAAIVLAAYQNRTPGEIITVDIEELFAELDLLSHLSATRGNGLRAMVSRVIAFARNYAAT